MKHQIPSTDNPIMTKIPKNQNLLVIGILHLVAGEGKFFQTAKLMQNRNVGRHHNQVYRGGQGH
jgi:hypothetical protein